MKNKFWEIFFIAILVVVGFISYYFLRSSDNGNTAIIKIGQEKYLELDLKSDKTVQVVDYDSEYLLTVQVDNGAISVVDSSCFDHLCVLKGPVSKAGESIVCLPNRVVISISGNSTENSVDGVLQ